MRILDADVAADLRAGGGALLRIKCKTGEELGVELTPGMLAELRRAIAPPAAGVTANPT